MKCKKCNSENCIKKGVRNKTQRFYCKNCKSSFQNEYLYQAYGHNVNSTIKSLLKEGCGVRSIARILDISSKTVLARILEISKQIKRPHFNSYKGKFEIDEMYVKIISSKIRRYLTYAIDKQTKQVISFRVGRRSKEVIKSVVDKVLMLNPKKVHTDKLNNVSSI